MNHLDPELVARRRKADDDRTAALIVALLWRIKAHLGDSPLDHARSPR